MKIMNLLSGELEMKRRRTLVFGLLCLILSLISSIYLVYRLSILSELNQVLIETHLARPDNPNNPFYQYIINEMGHGVNANTVIINLITLRSTYTNQIIITVIITTFLAFLGILLILYKRQKTEQTKL